MAQDKSMGSVTHLLKNFQDGSHDAANELIGRYYDRVVRAASYRLRNRGVKVADGEDIAASVFESLWARASDKKKSGNTDLQERDDLWRLLCCLMRSKTSDAVRRERAQKRGGGMVRGESVFEVSPNQPLGGIDNQAGTDICPKQQALMAERHRLLMEELGTDAVREIVVLRLEGHDIVEISERMNVSTRTVKRKLSRAREIWARLSETED